MESHRELLRQFVSACKKNPGILHDPQFSFYKEWLESLGAKIPPSPPKADESESKSAPASEPEPVPEPESESEEQVESDVELDMSGVIEGDKDEPLPMGDEVQWVSEEDEEKAIEFKNAALSYFSDGDMEKAIENFTKAIELNPYSAILHAKRASALLKVNKPNAAIRDCDKAIGLNADCAAAYKFRGRAHRYVV
ncbi:hypothetical protein AB6A40_010030 [Gnathostoma spinigerum]|uniref:Hsp70-interacting protein N-terminal domain-containing protein n=1 Tax=Gnathostoma spinigerum TaxID=75299 RepID=A0ABD6F0B8_9BILA